MKSMAVRIKKTAFVTYANGHAKMVCVAYLRVQHRVIVLESRCNGAASGFRGWVQGHEDWSVLSRR